MYEPTTAQAVRTRAANLLTPHCSPLVKVVLAAIVAISASFADAQIIASSRSVIRKISETDEKLELTVNSSQILTLEKRIPRVQVNNPELLSVTPLSATQVQVSAKKAGVTAINLWDEDGQIHAVDVFIYGDVRELEHALKTQYPNSSIKVYRYSQALVLTGFIDRPDFVNPIVELAQDYSPKVINNISVGGVQQVLLKVKVYEVSRTKLRQLGIDFATISPDSFFASGVSQVFGGFAGGGVTTSGSQTVQFGVTNGDTQFFGLLDALQQNNLAKILAEPNLVAVSGRPAQFNEGGEIPIPVPSGLNQISIEYKKFGTQVDFLPIVLGNGNIRLEVRPRVSSLDPSNAVSLVGATEPIPGLVVREVDTAVEMKAGQTFALAGLIQRQTEAVNRGLPYFSDLPIIGVPFRRMREEVNEVELLILVTPEFIDAMDPHQVPPCYPGAGTMSPDNCELYWGGHVEVPNRCNGCASCECVPTHGHEPCCPGKTLGVDNRSGVYSGSAFDGAAAGFGPGGAMPINGGYGVPTPAMTPGINANGPVMEGPVMGSPYSSGNSDRGEFDGGDAMPIDQGQHGELVMPPQPSDFSDQGAAAPVGGPSLGASSPGTASRHYSAGRKPEYQRHASRPYSPTPGATPTTPGGLIGPVGYDAEE